MQAIVHANAHGSVRYEGQIIRLLPGQPWAADDPFVIARPDLFTDDPAFVHRTTIAPVETATRRPGERRNTRA